MSADEHTAAPQLRIGLVGLKNHGQTILRAILEAENLRMTACADVDARACEIAEEAYGVRTYTSYEELLGDALIDAVALVTPNDLHAKQAIMAFERGKHVFLEKPIANNAADARAIIEAGRGAGRVLMVGHNTRRKRAFRAAAECFASGELGTVIAIEANLSRHVGLESAMPEWKADPSRCVLLPMSQLGIHFIDAARYLLGPLRDVSAVAENRAMPGGTLDTVCAVFRSESGVPVTISSYYTAPDTYVFRVYGSDAVMTCEPNSALIEHVEPARRRQLDFSDEGYESFVLQMREFARCALDGDTPESSGENALEALAAVLAMEDSARSGRRITIAEHMA